MSSEEKVHQALWEAAMLINTLELDTQNVLISIQDSVTKLIEISHKRAEVFLNLEHALFKIIKEDAENATISVTSNQLDLQYHNPVDPDNKIPRYDKISYPQPDTKFQPPLEGETS